MQTASVALTDKLQKSPDVQGAVRVIAEWNYNRFAPNVTASNGSNPSSNEFDNDLFPLSSIIEPERPHRGNVKAIVGETFVTGPYIDSPDAARFVLASDDDIYKYWVSPTDSGASSPFPITNVAPTVIYGASVNANKIHICIENSVTSPTAYTVQTTVDGTNWVTVATNPAINSTTGVIELYLQTNGTWSTTVNRTITTPLRGVRLNVTQLGRASTKFSLISMGLRREDDISSYVKGYSIDATMSDTSFVTPIGKISSNEAEIQLDNTSQIFTNSNASSPYYNLLEKNVWVKIEVGINIGTYAAPNYEWIRQFTGRSMSWPGQSPDGTSLSLSDSAVYLQEAKPPKILFTEMTAGEIIWRLLDSVGFSNWAYSPTTNDPTTLIPAFWCDGSTSVWEVIAEVAEVTQTAVFFDEYGVLKILPRSVAYSATSPTWQFNGQPSGANIPDIFDLNVDTDFEANTVDIEYTPTAISEQTYSGVRPMEIVWEPEGTVTLRSSQLTKTIFSNSTEITIPSTDARTWPYTSVVQIEGEYMRYDAKEYAYFDAAGASQKKFIENAEEKEALDKLNPAKMYFNSFTGKFRVPAGNRGIWGTIPKSHATDYNTWTSKRIRTGSGAPVNWSGGFIGNPSQSYVRLKSHSSMTTSNSHYVATVGSSSDTNQPIYYGTRLRFTNDGNSDGSAGIVIGAGTSDSGYFIELKLTETITNSNRTKYYNEVWISYKDPTTGGLTRLGTGSAAAIVKGRWYDLDVKLTPGTNSRTFNVLLNGAPILTAAHNATIPTLNKGARSGIFIRRQSQADFEYFYNSIESENLSFTDDPSWWDRIDSGWKSNQFDGEFSYGRYNTVKVWVRGGISITSPDRHSKRYMDEFGPIVHEVREYDVDFANTPVLHSNLYMSNDSQGICLEYSSDPFGAKFILGNYSRNNAVVNGEDTLTFGADNPVDQKLLVYGRVFEQKDARTHTVKDDYAIKKRGKISTQIASKWIQSEDAAKALGEWILAHWAGGNDQVSLEAFGNPLIQIGDVVSINSSTHNMAPATHSYFVVGISHSYNNGLKSSYILRRKKI